MNNVVLTGRPTTDPDVRIGQKKVARFNIAVRRTKDSADFINCIAFDKVADFAERYLKKGNRVLVKGRIQTGAYEKDGHKIYTTDVVCDVIEPIDWEEPTRTQPEPQATPQQISVNKNEQNWGMEITEDDLPF